MVDNLQNPLCYSLYLGGKLLQALLLAIAFRYKIVVGWVLLFVGRSPSPCISLFGNVGVFSKGVMLAIDIACIKSFNTIHWINDPW